MQYITIGNTMKSIVSHICSNKPGCLILINGDIPEWAAPITEATSSSEYHS